MAFVPAGSHAHNDTPCPMASVPAGSHTHNDTTCPMAFVPAGSHTHNDTIQNTEAWTSWSEAKCCMVGYSGILKSTASC